MRKYFPNQGLLLFPDSIRKDLQAVSVNTDVHGVVIATGAAESELYVGEVIPKTECFYQVTRILWSKPLPGSSNGMIRFEAEARELKDFTN